MDRGTGGGLLNAPPDSLSLALAAAALPPRDRFAFLQAFGSDPAEALHRVLRTLPAGRRRNGWPTIDLAAELVTDGRITVDEAMAGLRGIGVNPLSLFSSGGLPAEPTSLARAGLPADCLSEFRLYGEPALHLTGCRSMERLPAGLKCHTLSLNHFPRLRALEEGLEVVRNLAIRCCGLLEELPRSLGRLRRLDIESCSSLRHLPRELIPQVLRLVDLPSLEVLEVSEDFTGRVFLSRCPRLRRFILAGSRCQELKIKETGLAELEGPLTVGGDVHLSQSATLDQINGPLRIHGSLRLSRLTALKGLGPRIHIDGNLDLCDVPEGFVVPEQIEIGGQIILDPPIGRVVVHERHQGKVVEIP